ncbi:MAG: Crp/Fnr family transcriptional regulator [Chloroflexi bacterium]|nr:Crp/Fnr family transcriptional regulator [Chloroflexota bacterium]
MSPAKNAEILKKSLIFSSLNEDELSALAGLAAERSFQPDEFILWEGDEPDYFYVVAEGQVKVVKNSSTGREFIIAFFGPGEMFGEVAVFEGKPYPASAQATSACRILAIKRQSFLDFLATRPQVALRIINILGGRLRDAQGRLKDFAGERVEQRLARILLMLASRMGTTLRFTRQELADMAGTTTETAIRVTGGLSERGIIITSRGQIIIADEAKLKALAEGPPEI